MFIGIPWHDSFSLGFEPLDDQHKKIFKLTAEIDSLLATSAPDKTLIEKFKSLRQLLLDHFHFEESLALKGEDPACEEMFRRHHDCHDQVLTCVSEVISTLPGGDISALTSLVAQNLLETIVEHDGEMVSALAHAGKIVISSVC
jgi:hemerythrin-like metal-binding protein